MWSHYSVLNNKLIQHTAGVAHEERNDNYHSPLYCECCCNEWTQWWVETDKDKCVCN